MNRILFFCVLMFLGISANAQNSASILTSDSIINWATNKIRLGEYKEASNLLESISELSPSYPLAVYNLSRAYINEKEYQKASVVLEDFIKKNPEQKDASIEVELLRVYFLNKNTELAKNFADKLIKKYPHHGPLFELLGYIEYENNNFDKAEEYFLKTVHQMPLNYNAHLFLGMSNYKKGNLTLGTLPFLMCLTIEPESDKTTDLITTMIKELTSPHPDKDNYKSLEKNLPNLVAAEEILRNRYALSKNYNNELGLDEPILNQLHALLYSIKDFQSSNKDNFYSSHYISFLQKLMKESHYKGFIYHILKGVNASEIQKKIKKASKENELFARWLKEEGLLEIIKRNKNYDGTLMQEPVYYFGNYNVNKVSQLKDKKLNGTAYFIDADNSEIIGEYTYANGVENAVAKRFYSNKKVKEELNFVEGVKNGEYKSFYESGAKKEVYNLKDDKITGLYYSYYPFGDEQCKIPFVNDQSNGDAYCKYSNGKIYWQATFKEGNLNGIRKEYLANGQLIDSANYIDNYYNGERKTFHNNGKTSGIENWKNGREIAKQTYFYYNGNQKSEYNYSDNNQILNYKGFNFDETLNYEEFYSNGLVNGLVKTFYSNAKPKSELEFKNGLLKFYTPYDLDGKPLFEKKITVLGKKENKFYNSIGNLYSKGVFSSSGKSGNWEFYRHNILLTQEYYNPKNGMLNGEATEYYINGEVKSKIDYKDGMLNGKYTFYYTNGQVDIDGKHLENKPFGEFSYYDDKGNLLEKRFFEEEEGLLTSKIYYDLNKKPVVQFWYDEDKFIGLQDLWSGKSKISFSNLKDGVHEIDLFHNNQKFVITIKNGMPNGSSKFLRKDGVLINEANFIDGKYFGKRKIYDVFGQLTYETNNINNESFGKEIYYDYNGVVKNKSNTAYDNVFDADIDYYPNGNKFIESNYFNNDEYKSSYFDSDGNLMFSLYRLAKEIVKIEYPNNTSRFLKNKEELIEIKNKEGILLFKSSVKNGMLEGEYIVNYTHGKPYLKKTYKNENLEGKFVLYYENGNVYKESNYLMDNLDGETKVFYPNGKIRAIINYKKDLLFGKALFYDAKGTLTKSITYANGFAVEVN